MIALKFNNTEWMAEDRWNDYPHPTRFQVGSYVENNWWWGLYFGILEFKTKLES